MLRISALLYLCLFLVVSACTGTKSVADLVPEKRDLQDERLLPLRDTIQDWIDRGLIPSMAVGVIHRGEVLWLQAYGKADIEAARSATPQTIYALGSLSKSISSTGVMTLVEQGKISLDDTVNPLIRPARLRSDHWSADSVLVWHVLNSSAGLPHGWASYNNIGDVPVTDAQKDALFHQYATVALPPGRYVHYANYSFGVADMIMERVSRMELEDYLQQALFQPLGMQHSRSRYFSAQEEQYAQLYHRDLSVAGHSYSIPYGGLGYYASAADLLRYARLHLKHQLPSSSQVLHPDRIERMQNFDRSDIFQLGWHHAGHAIISNGSVTGANSNLTLVPDEDLAVVCLTNVTSFNGYADQMADRIIDALLPDLVKQMTYEKYVAEYENPYQPTPELAGTWSGTVDAVGEEIPIQLSFPEDGSVMITLGSEAAQPLENTVYNRRSRLTGTFSGKVAAPGYVPQEPRRMELMLQRVADGQLSGYVGINFSNDKGGFRFGAPVFLRR